MKRKLTEQDLIDNPELKEKEGLKVGDEIEIPDPELTEEKQTDANANENTDDDTDDDTGGSAPPPTKERGN